MDRKTFDAEISCFLSDAVALISKRNAQEETPGAFGWFRWEMDLWNVGEQIRQCTIRHDRSLSMDQARDILDICLTRAAGKGRQSFALLLGKVKYRHLAEPLSALLSDGDVCGHVINTLYKMKAEGYADRIRPFLTDSQSWIRKEAVRYLQKYE